MSINVIDGVIF